MKRKMYNRLLQWKEHSRGRTALLIQGAPCVGKSYLAEQFAKNEYDSYIRIDFAAAEEAVKDMLLHDLDDLDTFFLKLEVLYNTKLYERKSVVIFDDVQRFPEIHRLVGRLVADGRYDYIGTGFLLSVKGHDDAVAVSPKAEQLLLYPMDFEEFLHAMGHEAMTAAIRDCFKTRLPLGASRHRRIMDLFRQYLIVGGFPQAVAEYVKSKDFHAVDQIKRKVLDYYRSSIFDNSKRFGQKVHAIFEEMPAQLRNLHQHFKFSLLKKGARYSEYEKPLRWLTDAKIVNCCYKTDDPARGLSPQQERTMLKCYLADTGLLLSHMYDEKSIVKEGIYRKLLLDDLEETMGMVLENVMAQMLAASGHPLYFYTNADRENHKNRMEIDFLLAKKADDDPVLLSPVKVKSGKKYKRSSLKKFMEKYRDQLHIPYDFHTNDVKEEDGIVYLPLYMAMFI